MKTVTWMLNVSLIIYMYGNVLVIIRNVNDKCSVYMHPLMDEITFCKLVCTPYMLCTASFFPFC